MSVLDDVFESLKLMSQLQLLLAFVACIGYLLAQGGLLEGRGRRGAWATAFAAAAGFILLGTDWMQAAMVVALAVVGLGTFTAAVWLMCRLIGMQRGSTASAATPAPVPALAVPSSTEGSRPQINRPVASA